MVRHPVAGNMFAFFHYVLGLHRLGHQVAYLEEVGWPNSCYNPADRTHSDDPSEGLRRTHALMRTYGVDIPIIYVDKASGRVEGASWEDVKGILSAADLLLNIGGVCWLPEFRLCHRLALVDMDPLFTQARRFGAEGLANYHTYFSYGVNIGQPDCVIPTMGINWLATVPPVALDLWHGATASSDAPLTTIANWTAYGPVTHEGERYGQKDEEFLRILNLPDLTPQRLELAVSGASAQVMERFKSAGWSARDGDAVSLDTATYRAYICSSRGELSVAKNAYVKTRSGWFSDRSVCYLAAGLPVILQDTGFSDWLPAGQGVLAFTSVGEAADCIQKVNSDYAGHRRTAREIAERVFDYRVVLPRLLDTALATSQAAAQRNAR